MSIPDITHFKNVAQTAAESGLVVLYGAGINYPQRPSGSKYFPGAGFLPTGGELAEYLAEKGDYPDHQTTKQLIETPTVGAGCTTCGFFEKSLPLLKKRTDLDLARVAQHAEFHGGYNFRSDMHDLFSRDYPVTAMHKTLAALPGVAAKGGRNPPIFVTTNYDVILEKALGATDHPFDVIYYRAPQGRNATCLHHWRNAHRYYQNLAKPGNLPPAAGTPIEADLSDLENPITDLADYGKNGELPVKRPDARTIIVKFHGSVAPPPRSYKFESLVVTQDDYIGFLRFVPLESPLPRLLQKPMQERDFLFLGYGLGDGNIMALCQNMFADRPTQFFQNWAVQKSPSQEETDRWNRESGNRVQLLDMDLSQYAAELSKAMNIIQ